MTKLHNKKSIERVAMIIPHSTENFLTPCNQENVLDFERNVPQFQKIATTNTRSMSSAEQNENRL